MISTCRHWLYDIIFDTKTRSGRVYDVGLMGVVLMSVCVVMADSMHSLGQSHGIFFKQAEWFFTLLFTLDYGARLFCAPNPKKYALSFFGVVDLLATLPTYVGLFLGGPYFAISHMLRVLRILRLLKLIQFVEEYTLLFESIRTRGRQIFVFIFGVLVLVTLFGSLMYMIEPPSAGFSSIPRSVYWAIVTLTTVGYGDISPVTSLGQFLAAMIMMFGYGIIAVPAVIVTSEMMRRPEKNAKACVCETCGGEKSSDKG